MNQRTLGGRAGTLGTGRSIYVASLFIMHIGMARSLGSAGYGSFQQVFIFNMFVLIFSLGIPETVFFFLPRLKEEERAGFIGQTLMLLAVSAAMVLLVLWTLAPFVAGYQGDPSLETNLRYFAVYGAFIVLSSFADPVFLVYERVGYLFVLSSLHGLGFIGLTLWRYYGGVSLATLFGAMAVIAAVKFSLALLFLRKIRERTGGIRLLHIRNSVLLQISFAFPIALSNSIDSISLWLDKFVVSFALGTNSLGVFSVGAIEIPFVGVLVSSVYSVISPVLNSRHHQGDMAGFIRLIRNTLGLLAKVVWPLTVYLLVFADHILPLAFTNQFLGAVGPFRVYLLVLPIRIVLLGVIVLALGQPRIILFTSAGSLVINLILSVVLVMKIGFIGPAVATVISTYVQAAVMLAYVLKATGEPFRRFLPLNILGEIALASCVAALIAWFLTRVYTSDLKVVLMSLTIFVGAYIFLGVQSGLFRITSMSDLLQGNFLGKNDQGPKGGR